MRRGVVDFLSSTSRWRLFQLRVTVTSLYLLVLFDTTFGWSAVGGGRRPMNVSPSSLYFSPMNTNHRPRAPIVAGNSNCQDPLRFRLGSNNGGALALVSSSSSSWSSSALSATCRICRGSYDPLFNDLFSCVYHPGSLRGESPRKSDWDDNEGDSKTKTKKKSIDNSQLVYTYTCCGGPPESEGCTRGKCKSYDDP